MRPVSAAFLRTVRGSHRAGFRARVVSGHQTGTNPTGTEIPILDGDVTLDAGADVRTTLDMTTSGAGMWPATPSDLLAPYGNEVFVERGVVLANGATEWVSQGYFRLYSAEQDDAPNGPIRLAARDRMSGIIDARLEAPRQFAASATIGSVLDALLLPVYPSIVVETDDPAFATTTLGRAVIVEEDRYEFLRDLVRAHGKTMFFDYRGVLVIKTAPNPAVPVVDINSGANGVLVRMTRGIDREGVFNAVVATGEAPDTTNPVRGVARDNNPDSPTYYYGAFGKVPRFYSSPFITTAAQARTAARAVLERSLGMPYSVTFDVVPNPALEPLDPIRVTYSDRHNPEVHVIESLTIPLTVEGAITGRTRLQTDSDIEVV